MATILNSTETCRVYVRGHIGRSRFFLSRVQGETLQRCQVPEAVADSLKRARPDVLDTVVGKYLDAARNEWSADYYEVKLEN